MGKITTDKRAGFTLMELMVYIAIVGIVVIVAGQAFSNSTKMRVRTQSMLKASEVAENVAAVFKQDVAQTGAKSSMEAGSVSGGDNFSGINRNVYMDIKTETDPDDKVEDLSSFTVNAQADGNSDLKVRRIRYDDNGHFKAVEEIRWFVESKTLKRSCWTVDGAADADNCSATSAAGAVAVEVATGVDKFAVKPALPGVVSGTNAQVFPPCTPAECPSEFRMVARTGETDFMETTINLASDHKSVSLSGFKTNYDKNTNSENASGKITHQVLATQNVDGVGQWKTRCTKVTLEDGVEYEISFSIADGGATEKSRMFVPGRDYLAVGFRSSKNGNKPPEVDDFLFYPPTESAGAGRRAMRFNVAHEVKNVCLAFTFVTYSPIAAEGTITISDLVLKKVESSNYNFDYTGTVGVPDKQNVKALMLNLVIKQNGEGGDVSLVVPIPSNGPTD